jgi:hypothetical protein
MTLLSPEKNKAASIWKPSDLYILVAKNKKEILALLLKDV